MVWRPLPAFLFIGALSGLVSATTFENCLRQNITNSEVVLPTSDEYDDATSSNNLSWQYDAAAVVFVANAADAAAAIKCAAAAKVSVTSRGGRHSYASFGSGGRNGSLVLDMAPLHSMTFDAATGLATVGSGFRLGNLALGLDARGRATAHGTCPFVGNGGHGTCGGFGFPSRLWGLHLDQIVRMTAVTAAGHVVEASPTSNADLFWALRGAGPSFASVLSYTIKTYPTPNVTTRFLFDFGDFDGSAKNAAQAFLAFQDFAATSAPPELGIRWTLNNTFGAPAPHFFLSGVYYGQRAAYDAAIQPLLDTFTVQPLAQEVTPQSYIDSVASVAFGEPLNTTGVPDTHVTAYQKSILVPTSAPLSLATWTNFTNFLFNIAIPAGLDTYVLEIDAFGGSYNGKPTAIPALDSNVSAFNGRDGLLLMQLVTNSATAGSYPQAGITYANALVGSVKASAAAEGNSVSAYACYVDAQMTADEAHATYFGTEKTHQLKLLKRKWDPEHVFNYPQAF